MGNAAVVEGRSILATLEERRVARLGVSGYSMGGNIAAIIGGSVRFPIAVAPQAPSHSPAPVYTRGILSRAVAWGALGGPEARDRLESLLGSVSALDFPPPVASDAAVLSAARDDGYIPTQAVLSLHHHWPGSELRWLKGGHASLYMFGKERLAQAIEDSFDRLGG